MEIEINACFKSWPVLVPSHATRLWSVTRLQSHFHLDKNTTYHATSLRQSVQHQPERTISTCISSDQWDHAVKSTQARHQFPRIQPTLRNTTYIRFGWTALDATRVLLDWYNLRHPYTTLRCIYHANSLASCTSTCNATHIHFHHQFLS